MLQQHEFPRHHLQFGKRVGRILSFANQRRDELDLLGDPFLKLLDACAPAQKVPKIKPEVPSPTYVKERAQCEAR
ncbi:hypothetical protein IVB18_18680 [Bradyrhizobium sp. 186]|uniref:hypothetical protein n=1 Tax=Bradyrhizobium sp. 186 TaxID=2782654 RepID=UPI00200062FE|nr:hypothetical protein [Bradyrhizobium sp. 186]UPK39077.1 hypothetical protein IVB18_18680 [Bradyrhizobium sp. 186]